MNSARSVMATIRSPIGMVDAGLPTSDGPSCWGLALMESIGGSLRFRLKPLCKVRRALRNAAGARQGHPPGMLTMGRTPRRGVQKSNLIKYAPSSPCRSAPGSSWGADPLTSRIRGALKPSRGPRPARSAWTEALIAASDRRRLVDDFAHRRGALFGGFQVLEDYRQRGRSAVLLNRESGTGNKARSHVDVLDLPDSPNHLIAPSSRPIPPSPLRCAAGAQSVASGGPQAVMPTFFGQLR